MTQQGTGASPGYSALDVRRTAGGALQEGVYGTSTLVTAGGVSNVASADFMVTQRAAGANQTVDVNMPAGGFAYVQGDTINGQGLYCVPVHSANINEAIAAADATNPRIDQVILEVQDNVLDASGGNLARTRVLTGTATSGATLANRTGAVALPGSALLLADILVPNASSSVPNANIRDRRKWARGAYVRIVRNANDAAGSDYTTTSTSNAQISTNFAPRIENSGVPVRIVLRGLYQSTAGDNIVQIQPILDVGSFDGGAVHILRPNVANADEWFDAVWEGVPAAGSHQYIMYWQVQAATTGKLKASATQPLEMVVEEIVRQNVPNQNGVTSG